MKDEELAASLAQGAGAILLEVRKSGIFSAEALGRTGDALANLFIAAALAENRPSDGLLSEELADSPARLAKDRVWVVDPLDGTREYSEGRSDWAIHVALAIEGRAAVGAVSLPAKGALFSSGTREATSQPQRDKLMIVVSRTRPPAEAEKVARLLGADLMFMGSCGAKAMAVLTGEADIYLHSGGQHEWDSCAPVAVAQAAGFHCSALNGDPLLYNREDIYVPDLLICRPDLAGRVLDALCS
jgi:3'(2'), 5'-bisphosphate nucleotidase